MLLDLLALPYQPALAPQAAVSPSASWSVRRSAPATFIAPEMPSAGGDGYASGKSKQNAVKILTITDTQRRLLSGGALKPGSCLDVTQARDAGLVELLGRQNELPILADAGYQWLNAQTSGQLITPPHRMFKKTAPAWWEERVTRQRKICTYRHIRPRSGAQFDRKRRRW
ncbi:transposase family protein [Streptomyces sp. NPDC058086]|uniref:transposase family protein n=1 Tax=Streptomyces sp. NPDC058086 TaxID=3346334 RepID=UPI0036E373B0